MKRSRRTLGGGPLLGVTAEIESAALFPASEQAVQKRARISARKNFTTERQKLFVIYTKGNTILVLKQHVLVFCKGYRVK